MVFSSVGRSSLAAGLCALSIAAAACGRTQPAATGEGAEEVAIPVAARQATVGRVREVLHASGLVVPAEGAEFLVYAPEPARVIEVTKKEGDAAASGETLVRFDLPSSSGDVARLRAELARARAELEHARVAQARARDFAERGLVSRRDGEDADRLYADAQTAVTRAEAAQAAAEASAARATVRAPFDGIVAKVLHQPGDVVQGSVTDPVLRLVDTRRLEVSASVPAQQLARAMPGTTARLAGTAVVRLILAARAADGTVRLAPVDPLELAVDTPVQVDIDLDERATAVLVPPQAVGRDGAATVVFVASGDRAERREVTTGASTDDSIEIASGVRAGELVIVRGQSGLQDGARITVATAGR